MIEYAPPGPMRILLMIEDIERAVVVVMAKAMRMIVHAPSSPVIPTTQPRRRYIITPRMVRRVGMKTPLTIPNLIISSPD